MNGTPTPAGQPTTVDAARVLLDTLRRFVAELRARPEADIELTLDSSLERDLGIDSLGRVELLTRIERAFNVSLAERVLASAETPRDLLAAVIAAGHLAPAAVESASRAAAPQPVEGTPQHAQTLIEVLDWHVRAHPERTHITLPEDTEARTIGYSMLRRRAGEVAAGLLEHDVRPGQSVAIMLPTSEEYFYCFFGVLLAGGVPVPIYPPARVSQIEDHLRRHAGILANALAVILITVPEAKTAARLLKAQVAELRAVVTPDDLTRTGADAPGYVLKGEDTALLQYTSGSTGSPKGVVLTHANLLANIRAMGQAVDVKSTDVFVSWLPLYHDMGLIGAWLGSLYFACAFVVMSPLAFLARPERWLWTIHRYRGTFSAAPNFGYELCLRKASDAALTGLDLSSWRMAFNGAEPVSPETVMRFTQRFARYGLHSETMAPVYGLAECAVGLAFPPPGRGVLIDHIQRERFMRDGRAEPAGDAADALRLVACGRPLPGHQIRIVDATGREVGERVEGRLEFRGPSATAGYFRNPQQNKLLFHGEWLDSGDYAYIASGDVYLTGRAKDIIIRGGRNIYPYELEEAVGNIAGIRKGCVAVFGSPDPVAGTERLIVMAEVREADPTTHETLRAVINDASLDVLGMPADDIVLVPPHTVLKTSSGKIRRSACRELYEKGEGPQRAVWWQITRLAWTGMRPALRRLLRVARDLAYAAYVWLVFWLLAPLTWLATLLSPRAAWGWAVSRVGARLFLSLARVPHVVQGIEHLPRGRPCVLVSNHTSYLDGILMVAALPGELSPTGYFSFVAKGEFSRSVVPGPYLRHLGALFVERFDLERGIEDARYIVDRVRAGHAPIFFPEGTLSRVPGLMPFRLGAFAVAAEADVPVVPVTIQGARSILRDGQWLPRRGELTLTIGRPIAADGADWAAAVRLRDAVRAEILRQCGEPDLAAQ